MGAAVETLEEIREEIEEIVNAKEAEKEDYLQKAAAARKRKEEALNEASAAYSVADVKAYHKAKDEARMNEDAAAMYEGIAKVIEEKTYITKEQFNEYIARINKCLDSTMEENRLILLDLAKGMKEIRDTVGAEVTAGNELMAFVQKKAYKDPCGIFAKNGEFIPQSSREKRYKNTGLLEALRFMLREPYLKEVTKDEEKEGGLKSWV